MKTLIALIKSLFITEPQETPSPKPLTTNPVTLISCEICYSNLTPSNFPQITVNCTHKNNVCSTCMARHCEAEINSKGVLSIKCPIDRFVLAFNDVERLAAKKDFERFDTLLVRMEVQKLDDFRWCKVASCGSGQIHDDGGGGSIMQCHACKSKSCFYHDLPWHTGQTCAEYDLDIQNKSATIDYLERYTKTCPNCTAVIVKDGGCDHLTCKSPSCGHHFCWLCLADYKSILTNGNHMHKITCTHYAASKKKRL